VIGVSLGARTINESIAAGLSVLAEKNIQLVWQTGKTFFETAKAAVGKFPGHGFFVQEFITKMDYAYAAADVVVSRAGAGSVSELSIVHKPSILVPSPNDAEDHQTKNAMALVSHKAALIVKDSEAKNSLVKILLELTGNEELRNSLEKNIAGLAVKDSADLIASETLSLINRKRKK